MTVMSRQQWFTQALSKYCQIAIAGSHGKTTTTGLSTFLLHQQVCLDAVFLARIFSPPGNKPQTDAQVENALQDHRVPFVCGGEVYQLPLSLIAKPAHACPTQKQALVIEACEYNEAFLGLEPMVAVLTNIDHEHIDCYPCASDLPPICT